MSWTTSARWATLRGGILAAAQAQVGVIPRLGQGGGPGPGGMGAESGCSKAETIYRTCLATFLNFHESIFWKYLPLQES